MKKLAILLTMGLLLSALFTVQARADMIIHIDFATGFASPDGTVSYSGGASPLVGDSIGIGIVSGINTPANAGAYEVTNGILSFTTGINVAYSAGVYTFAGGGTINIVGGVPDASVSDGTALLTGSFVSASYDQVSGTISLTLLTGSDTKDEDLLAWFGLSADTLFSFTGTLHGDPTSANGEAFVSESQHSTDITNTVVPEPTTLLLLGSGLIGLAGFARRRFHKK
jgi:hypothetical protein